MSDFYAFGWIVLGVLLSAVLPYAVAAIWPKDARVMRAVSPREIFLKLWPGIRLVLASLVVGGVALVVAMATEQAITVWWQGVLVGMGADRAVSAINTMLRR